MLADFWDGNETKPAYNILKSFVFYNSMLYYGCNGTRHEWVIHGQIRKLHRFDKVPVAITMKVVFCRHLRRCFIIGLQDDVDNNDRLVNICDIQT
jgi:hypothetical protein